MTAIFMHKRHGIIAPLTGENVLLAVAATLCPEAKAPRNCWKHPKMICCDPVVFAFKWELTVAV
jgi:hypothetical protein